MKKLILPFLLAFTIPLSATAQFSGSQGETCGMESNSEEARDYLNSILGTWTLSHQSGYVTFPGRVLPFPAAGDAEQQTFVREGPELFMVDGKTGRRMQFFWAMEGDWTFGADDAAAGVPAPTLSSNDLELVMNCSLSEMPRLIGKADIIVDGVTMNFVYRVALMGSGVMYGVMHVSGVANGYPYMSRRTVAFTQ